MPSHSGFELRCPNDWKVIVAVFACVSSIPFLKNAVFEGRLGGSAGEAFDS